MFHIGRESTNLGAFSQDQVRQGLASGRFLRTDLGWKEGMAAWQPLSTFAEFMEAPPLPAAPGESPTGTLVEGPLLDPRVGLPWEHRQEMGNVQAFIETVKMVLLTPSEAFTRMRLTGGLKEPLIYNIAGGWPSIVIAYSFQFLLAMAGSGSSQFAGTPLTSARGIGAMMGVVILGPLLILLGAFLGSFFTHASLTLLGGANKPFEATMRVVCFSSGSAQLFQIIPVCGGAVGGIWQIVCLTIGLSKVHEISIGRALAAVFLPIIVCCGTVLVLAIALPALFHGQNAFR